MSGYKPDYIEKGATIYVDDQPREVKDYYFASLPGHNNDKLVIVLSDNTQIDFDDRVSDKSAAARAKEQEELRQEANLPAFLKEGGVVRASSYSRPDTDLVIRQITMTRDEKGKAVARVTLRENSKFALPHIIIYDPAIANIAPAAGTIDPASAARSTAQALKAGAPRRPAR